MYTLINFFFVLLATLKIFPPTTSWLEPMKPETRRYTKNQKTPKTQIHTSCLLWHVHSNIHIDICIKDTTDQLHHPPTITTQKEERCEFSLNNVECFLRVCSIENIMVLLSVIQTWFLRSAVWVLLVCASVRQRSSPFAIHGVVSSHQWCPFSCANRIMLLTFWLVYILDGCFGCAVSFWAIDRRHCAVSRVYLCTHRHTHTHTQARSVSGATAVLV